MVSLVRSDRPRSWKFQPTAFGAQDRSHFDGVVCSAPWPQLNGTPFGVLSRLTLLVIVHIL
jgi:hypothetical protein